MTDAGTHGESAQPTWKRRLRRLALDLGVVALVLLAVRAYQQRGAPEGPAPDFEAEALDGGALALSGFEGRPVVVHFWASWCGVCRAMEGNVVRLAEGEVPVVRVATRSGSAEEVRRYLREHGEDPGDESARHVVLDPDGAIAARYGVRALPTTFWIDADGEIRHVEVGYTTYVGLWARRWLSGL